MFLSIWQHYQIMKDHSKITNIHFWMIQKAKNEVFGNFLEFGLFDWLDVAYCDSIKCLPTFGNVTRSSWIIQKIRKMHFWVLPFSHFSFTPSLYYFYTYYYKQDQTNIIKHHKREPCRLIAPLVGVRIVWHHTWYNSGFSPLNLWRTGKSECWSLNAGNCVW